MDIRQIYIQSFDRQTLDLIQYISTKMPNDGLDDDNYDI